MKKQVRLKGKPHGDIPRPNVKEPNINTNPVTGEKFKNGYNIRRPEQWELPKGFRWYEFS